MNTLKALLPLAALASTWTTFAAAQTSPVVVEAESGSLGSSFLTGTQSGANYITIATTVGGSAPGDAARVAQYNVTFPEAGIWELYVRVWVGPVGGGANDDSLYYGNGFGTKAVSDGNQWNMANNIHTPVGYTDPFATIADIGSAGTQVWKWIKLSGIGYGDSTTDFVVPAGGLTQTFQLAGREDGLFIDKFAFGPKGVLFTVDNLDKGQPGSGAPPFVPTSEPIAKGKSKFLGSVYSTTQIKYFDNYWNQVTPENASKWGVVEGTRDVMNWAELDAAYAFAKSRGIPFKFHTMVWGSQAPGWIASLDPAQQLEEIREWYAAVAARYPNIDLMDVVNEPIRATLPTYINALGGSGVTGWDWVINSFRLAREYFPNTKLILNEYGVTNDNAVTLRYLGIIELLQEENLIDGIGIQQHAFETWIGYGVTATRIKGNLDILAASGLPIYISEMDIDGSTDAIQLAEYKRVFPIFWEHPSVVGITMWGYRPGMWRSAQGAILALENGAERAALVWMRKYVNNDVPVITAGQTFNLGAAAPNVVGKVLATDADEAEEPGSTELINWSIVSGNEAGIFAINPTTGVVTIAKPTLIDFKRTGYPLVVKVEDGYGASVPTTVTVAIPNQIRVTLRGQVMNVYKLTVPSLLRSGATIGAQ